MKRYLLLPIGLFSLVLFVVLGLVAHTGPLPIDTSVALWFKAHRTAGEVHWAQMMSALTTPIIVFAVIVSILLYINYWTRSWYARDFIPLVLVISCAAISTLAKPLFDRARPGAGLTTMFDFEPSYPSSHVTFMAAAGCSLIFMATRGQFLIIIAVIFVTALVGVNRMVLGVHWFTDGVGAGFLTFGVFIIFYVLDDWLAEKERNRS